MFALFVRDNSIVPRRPRQGDRKSQWSCVRPLKINGSRVRVSYHVFDMISDSQRGFTFLPYYKLIN